MIIPNMQQILKFAQYVPQIVKIVRAKFEQYKDAKKALHLYQDVSLEFTSVFQGDVFLEEQKQTVFVLMEHLQYDVIEFLKIYDFKKLYNTQLIKQKFFNIQMNSCLIDLKEIVKDSFSEFTSELGTKNEIIWLNKSLTKINYILVLYFQVKFNQSKIEDEFLLYFPEILEFIQTQILQRAKQCLPQAYKKLKQLLEQICDFNMQSINYLGHYVLELKSNQNLNICQEKITTTYNQIIENYNKNLLEEVKINYLIKDNQETRDKFKVSEIFLNKGHKIIRNMISHKVLNSLENYKQRDITNLKKAIRNIIIKQLNQETFIGGIQEQQINHNLQLIILSIFWVKFRIDYKQIEILINELGKFYEFQENIKNNYLIDQQNLQKGNIDLKNQINKFKMDSQKAIEWYNQNVNEETNILVICQIYLILANIKFQNSKIFFGNYDSEARNILFIIVQHLNDLQFGYFNHEILKICEIWTHQIQIKLYQDINKKIFEEKQNVSSASALFKQRIKIEIDDESYYFLLQDTSISILKSPSVIGKAYHYKHELFECILNSNQPIQKYFKEEQQRLIQSRLQLIQKQITEKKNCNQYKFINHLVEPSMFHFTTLSTNENNSNVITLCISGFLSKKENKTNQWKLLLNQLSGTVIGLHWDSKDFGDIISQFKNFASNAQKFKQIDQLVNKNEFSQATQEAKIVGQFLAHFLDSGHLFGGRQINILCHSLGSELVYECVHELDRFSQNKLINDIILFGGVADVNQLAKRRWNSVSGSVYNLYTKNDNVLKYCLKFNDFFKKPCGLNPVQFGYKKIYNYDVSDLVDGHSGYWEKLDILLNKCDFNSDYKVLVKNVQEIY